jgi:hypothetical protein
MPHSILFEVVAGRIGSFNRRYLSGGYDRGAGDGLEIVGDCARKDFHVDSPDPQTSSSRFTGVPPALRLCSDCGDRGDRGARRPDLDLPTTTRCARLRPDLLCPASFIFQDRRSNGPLGTYPVMSERGLHS